VKLLSNKVAVITGSAAPLSIGLATARVFAEHGARIALVDIDDEIQARQDTLVGAHSAYVADVSDHAQCEQTTAKIIDAFGRIDVLVNSAGVVKGTPLLDISQQEYDQILDVNLRGSFNMAQAVLPHMRARGVGSIICMSSIAGQSGGGVFGSSHYAAAKSGIFGLSKALARELAPEGIRVNAVAPGPIDNNFTKGRMTREIKNEIAKKIPMGRLGEPIEVANACLFLASNLSSYVTGIVLDVNGGLLIH